jgi:hypothetical protein
VQKKKSTSTLLYKVCTFVVQEALLFPKYARIIRVYKHVMLHVTLNHILKYSCTSVNIGKLSNHVNLCRDFFLLSLFNFKLFIIIVYDNNKDVKISFLILHMNFEFDGDH